MTATPAAASAASLRASLARFAAVRDVAVLPAGEPCKCGVQRSAISVARRDRSGLSRHRPYRAKRHRPDHRCHGTFIPKPLAFGQRRPAHLTNRQRSVLGSATANARDSIAWSRSTRRRDRRRGSSCTRGPAARRRALGGPRPNAGTPTWSHRGVAEKDADVVEVGAGAQQLGGAHVAQRVRVAQRLRQPRRLRTSENLLAAAPTRGAHKTHRVDAVQARRTADLPSRARRARRADRCLATVAGERPERSSASR